jgi:gamma-glutamylputrescine oxidase
MTAAPYPDSYYAATADFLAECPPLDGSARCDVCVIGGGYTGVSTALHLAERGHDVILLEAERLGWGASGRNGGQVNSGQRRDQDALEAMVGKDDAYRLWQLGEEAKALVRSLIARHAIACDLKAGVLCPDHRKRYVARSHAYAAKLRDEYGYSHARAVGREEMREMLGTDSYHGGWIDGDAAHLHPLNYLLGLARAARAAGVRMFEATAVRRLGRSAPIAVETAGGTVTADHVVLACNGYLDGIEPRVEARIMPINNFILATEPLGEEGARALIRDDVAVADSRFVINYFRLSADRRLLFGGGETYSREFPRDLKSFVRRPMLEIFPQLEHTRIDYAWGGTLAVTVNRLPYFAHLEPGIFTASGYSGQGVALGTLAGQIMAEAIDGTMGRFDVFARIPTMTFPGGKLLRWPTMVAAMTWYALKDRI